MSSVIASEAKQSILPLRGEMDCFVATLLAVDGARRPPESPHPSHSTQDNIPYDRSSAKQNAIKQNQRRKNRATSGGNLVRPLL
ncbi:MULTISPECIES: hypothetical protein [unclassified Bradyrhizobium]|uniref:hypothetical protein n=1 Tax=unclassified Bradyrhizobium TaxID=2631580 RepID=UPI001BA8194E|nr:MULTISPECIES: hypothetical protein [unclassified Bradyrhizobium]MBR1228158.1 hypothetical protein [Bradyrhizobium sp. AUGA SZCCT0176]MBR1301989.1 hypothetical protein [Bradyrhizobium sp. AUGA SZCCT0042]